MARLETGAAGGQQEEEESREPGEPGGHVGVMVVSGVMVRWGGDD